MPSLAGWLGIAFTFEGLKALGLPQASLDSFPIEFRQGMAARAAILHDVGANAPANWEHPFGTKDVHIALAIYASNDQDLQRVLELARNAHHDLPQISVVYRMQLANCREDAIRSASRTDYTTLDIEGSGPAVRPGSGAQIKAGEFIMGYPDELGELAKPRFPRTAPQRLLRRTSQISHGRRSVS